jgi:hypothetical protein
MPQRDRPGLLGQRFDKAVVDAGFDHQPGTCGADLTGVFENRASYAGDCAVEIAVIKHDHRRLAAQFHHRAGDVFGAGVHHAGTGRYRPGEGNVVDTGMGNQWGTNFNSGPGHDIADASG